MKHERWQMLMSFSSTPLTEKELEQGWHFCPDWDGLLIGPGMSELECCRCRRKEAVMNERTLKIYAENPNDYRLKKLAKYWDTLLLWSQNDPYLKIKEIARQLKVTDKTVSNRVQWFKKHCPEAYYKAKDDRASAKHSTTRLDASLKKMNNGEFISYEPSMDEYIKEVF